LKIVVCLHVKWWRIYIVAEEYSWEIRAGRRISRGVERRVLEVGEFILAFSYRSNEKIMTVLRI